MQKTRQTCLRKIEAILPHAGKTCIILYMHQLLILTRDAEPGAEPKKF